MADLVSDEQFPHHKVQREFAAYLRNPDQAPAPSDIEQRRIDIYVRLFFNNVDSFCSKTFKKFREIVDDNYWNGLIRGFLANHQCHSPYFTSIPFEFLRYLQENEIHTQEYPYMHELCHYEAIKLELRLAGDCEMTTTKADLKGTDVIKTSPLVRLLSYEWPVDKICAPVESVSKPATPTWIIAYRNRRDAVNFLVSNARTLRMLELLSESQTIETLINTVASEFKIEPTTLEPKLMLALRRFLRIGVVLLQPDESNK